MMCISISTLHFYVLENISAFFPKLRAALRILAYPEKLFSSLNF